MQNITEAASLSVRELLTQVYEGLNPERKFATLTFPNPVQAEVADDSDGHRTRKGYFCFCTATLVPIRKKIWALSYGERFCGYPAAPFDSDIEAVAVDVRGNDGNIKSETQIQTEVMETLRRESYFSHALVIGLTDGRLSGLRVGRYAAMSELIRDDIEKHKYVAQQLELDRKHCDMNLMPIVKQPAKYKPELVPVLVDSINRFIHGMYPS